MDPVEEGNPPSPRPPLMLQPRRVLGLFNYPWPPVISTNPIVSTTIWLVFFPPVRLGLSWLLRQPMAIGYLSTTARIFKNFKQLILPPSFVQLVRFPRPSWLVNSPFLCVSRLPLHLRLPWRLQLSRLHTQIFHSYEFTQLFEPAKMFQFFLGR